MNKKRSTLNIILMFVYILLYIFAPLVLVMERMDKLVIHKMWYQTTAAFAVLFIIFTAIVLVTGLFPREIKKALTIFIPYIINGGVLFGMVYNHSYTELRDFLFVSSSITLIGLVFGLVFTIIFDSWYDEEQAEKGRQVILNNMRKKWTYIKKDPWITSAFIVLLIPLFFVMQLVSVSFGVHIRISNYQTFWSTLVYIAMVCNIVFFHYQDFRKYNRTIL